MTQHDRAIMAVKHITAKGYASQADIAREAKVDAGTISSVMHRRHRPRAYIAGRIIAACTRICERGGLVDAE